MSTKTTFKRIALVAVAALGLSLVAVTPSNAAPSAAYTTMYDTTNGTQVIGGQATVTFTTDTSTVTTFAVTGVGSVVSSAARTNSSETGTATSGSWTNSTNASGTGGTVIVLSSAVAGTQTITATPLGSNGAPGTAVTKTVTWIAAGTTKALSATNSTSILNKGDTSTATADVTTVADKAATGIVAVVKVTLKDGNTDAIYAQTISATIAGSGLIKVDTATAGVTPAGRASSFTLGAAENVAYVYVGSDGTSGVGTITISVGTTTISTETITFSGSAAAYAVTQVRGTYGASGVAVTGYETQTVTVKATDSAGNIVKDGTTIYAASATTTVATITASATTTSGVATFTVAGVAAGTSVITFGNAASSATVSTTTTITVGTGTIASVKLSTDKASYLPGEKIVLTVTAAPTTGPLADGTYTVFSTAPTSSMALSAGSLPGTSIAMASGVKTYTLNAPFAEGIFTIAGVDNLTALNAVSVSVVVEDAPATVAAQAATDAAAEATDAANAATDAANAAAEAADAATAAAQDAADAVAALSVAVTEMVSALKKQITALTNLVIKIQKKVKA
jgi:hypothetical protein